MNAHSSNARGAAFMMASMAGFALNDALIKSTAGELQLFQAIFLRGLAATALIAGLAACRGVLFARIPRRDRPLIGWRIAGEVGATTCFLTALFHMPLANATAILQAIPLAVTLAAAVFLKEPVGWRRYIAIAVGFAGVLLIVRPGSVGFTVYSLWALGAVGFLTLRDLVTRQLSTDVPSLFVTVCTSASITLLGAAGAIFYPWPAPGGGSVLTLGSAAVFLLVGYLFGVKAMRAGDIGYISPFRYSILVWAMILGLIVFGDMPDSLTILGAAVVVGTGVYTFHRERMLRRRENLPAAPSLAPHR